jgi:octopine oxidase subunit B
VGLEQPGGLQLCLGDEELEKRRRMMEQMRLEAGNFGFEYRMLDRKQVADILPGVGPSVAGASWTP